MARLSEITLADVKNVLRIDYDYDDGLILQIMDGARGFICDFTGLSAVDLDDIPQMVHAFYCLCGDMYDQRAVAVKDDKINPTVRQILLSHSQNYL